MLMLPDELWRTILEIGVSDSKHPLTYRDLCSLSITCRFFNRLSNEDSLWSSLLLSDFPPFPPFSVSNSNLGSRSSHASTSSSPSYKALYKTRYERDGEQKRLAHRRLVRRLESEIFECTRKIRQNGASVGSGERENEGSSG